MHRRIARESRKLISVLGSQYGDSICDNNDVRQTELFLKELPGGQRVSPKGRKKKKKSACPSSLLSVKLCLCQPVKRKS